MHPLLPRPPPLVPLHFVPLTNLPDGLPYPPRRPSRSWPWGYTMWRPACAPTPRRRWRAASAVGAGWGLRWGGGGGLRWVLAEVMAHSRAGDGSLSAAFWQAPPHMLQQVVG